LGQSAKAKLENIPLSNSTFDRRMQLISKDLLEHFIQKLRENPWYGLQFDESTDVTKRAKLRDMFDLSRLGRAPFCDDMGVETMGEVPGADTLNFS
jgi:hypothetical protein